MIDYLQLFQDYSVDFKESGKNVGQGFIGLNCPWCDDSSHHGGVPKDGSSRYTCWRCGTHSLNSTLEKILCVKNIESLLEVYTDGNVVAAPKKIITHATEVTVPGGELQWYHRNYLKTRNYDPDELISKYHIKGTTPTSKFGNRIYFPIFYKNEIVSYQGRSIDKHAYLRYLTAKPEEEKIFHKHILFNLDNANEDFIVLVEGVFDAIRLGDGACATFGTSFMREQLLLLKNYKRIFMLYDTEFFAQKKSKSAANDVAHITDSDVYTVDLNTIGDPDNLSADDVKYVMNEFRRKIY